MSDATTPATPPRTGRPLRAVGIVILVVICCVGLLLLVEGGASLYLLGHDYVDARLPRENRRPHTTFDTLLGWVNKPGAHSANEYGPGIDISVDAQGFRGTRTLTATPAPGVVRLACSGDSFTLGYGVDDAHTWCHGLESLIPGLETMNLGQAAYGLDQAYLWYMRDGVRYQPAVQVVALTYVQFERALSGNFDGRNKPFLALEGSRLVARGVPVPPQTDEALRSVYARRLLGDLRFMQWLRTFGRFDANQQAAQAVDARWPVFEAAFASLAEQHAKAGTTLVLAYLPVRRDQRPGPLDRRRARIAESAARLGIAFVDLTPALRAMRADSVDNAYLGKAPEGAAPGIEGHYTNLGNDWAARELAAFLAREPRVAARLAAARVGRAAR
jgi:hypothetical protein